MSRFYIIALLAMTLLVTSIAFAQAGVVGGVAGGFSIVSFLASLLGEGGLVMAITGWIKNHVTFVTLDGTALQIVSWIIAGLLTVGFAALGWLPIEVASIWDFVKNSLLFGLFSNILYKSGILANPLAAIGAGPKQ